jgi:hypothetical protein
MDSETSGHCTFLDIDIYRRPDGSLDHRLYRKPVYTNLYLNARLLHHLVNSQALLSTLTHTTEAIYNQEGLQAELD